MDVLIGGDGKRTGGPRNWPNESSSARRWGFSYVIVGANDDDKFAPVVAELAGN